MKKISLSSLWRNAAGILVCSLWALNFTAPTQADDVVSPFSETPIQLRVGTSTPVSLISQGSGESFRPGITAGPSALTNISLAGSYRPTALSKAALPQSSPTSRNKLWLALGIGGVVVVGVGAATYGLGHQGVCSNGYPSNGCHTTRTVGLVLMPVGGAMAVAGFAKYFHH